MYVAGFKWCIAYTLVFNILTYDLTILLANSYRLIHIPLFWLRLKGHSHVRHLGHIPNPPLSCNHSKPRSGCACEALSLHFYRSSKYSRALLLERPIKRRVKGQGHACTAIFVSRGCRIVVGWNLCASDPHALNIYGISCGQIYSDTWL